MFTTTNTRCLTAGLAMIAAGLAFTPTVGAATVSGVRCDLTARRVVCALPSDGVTVTLDTRVADAARPVAVTGRPGTLADFEGVPVRVGQTIHRGAFTCYGFRTVSDLAGYPTPRTATVTCEADDAALRLGAGVLSLYRSAPTDLAGIVQDARRRLDDGFARSATYAVESGRLVTVPRTWIGIDDDQVFADVLARTYNLFPVM